MPAITTHVLDLTRGTPAPGIPVVLEHEAVAGRWRVVTSSRTGEDGRVPNLTPGGAGAAGSALATGAYRLRFETGAYFKHLKTEHGHPRIEVAFVVSDAKRSRHVALLVSPFGYSTTLADGEEAPQAPAQPVARVVAAPGAPRSR